MPTLSGHAGTTGEIRFTGSAREDPDHTLQPLSSGPASTLCLSRFRDILESGPARRPAGDEAHGTHETAARQDTVKAVDQEQPPFAWTPICQGTEPKTGGPLQLLRYPQQ